MPWIVPLATVAYGAYQTARANSKRKKEEAALEKQAKEASANPSILDYYQKALAKYDPNPYNSAAFQQQKNMIGRNQATAMSGLTNRRLGIGGIAGLVQQGNDASARAVANAENVGSQYLGRLGQAAGAKAGQDQRIFDMNYNLKAMKAGQAASTMNSGIKNIFNGLSNAYAAYSDDVGSYGSDGSYTPSLRAISKMPRNYYSPEKLPY